MKKVAVILGSGLGALGALRAVSRLGIECYCYDELPGIESASRWYKQLPEGPDGGSLLDNLNRIPSSQIILIPVSDAMTRFAAALQESRPERFLSTLPKVSVVECLLNKSSLRRAIIQSGLPHPRTFEITSIADTQQIKSGTEDNFFLRPGDPHAFARIFGVRGLHPMNRVQLETFVTDILRSGFTISAQEIIPGPPETYVYLDGVFWDGEFKALFARRRLRMHPTEFGLSSCMTSIPIKDTLNAADDLQHFLTNNSFKGLFCAEFKIHNGIAKLLELIPRGWVYLEHSDRAGLNLVQVLKNCLSYKEQITPPYRVGFRMTHTDLDIKALRVAHRDNWTFLRNLIFEHFNSQHFLLSPDDPLPGLKNILALTIQGVKSIIRAS